MSEYSQRDRDLLRQAILAFMAPRFRAVYCAGDLARHLQRHGLVDMAPPLDEVEKALVVLKDKGLIRMVKETATDVLEYAEITGDGILEYERQTAVRVRP